MLKKIILLSLGVLCAWSTFAQNGRISGKVFDAITNTPLSGANIQIEGAGGATSDKDGLFSLDCRGQAEISVSYIGYESLKQKVACGTEVNIGLTPSATNLSLVEITATSNQNKSLLDQPASIVKLKETELKRGAGLYLDDAINANVPGVFMQRRTNSAGQQFNIRGYGNGLRGTNGINSNFDGQGSKVYLNGIAVTDAEGITMLDDIDFASIDNVEVSKGPSGTLYGLAIAGVVNLETGKAPAGQTSIGQDVMAGSYGLLRTTTRIGIGGNNSSLMVNYGHQEFDGYMVHTAAHKDFVNVMGDVQVDDKQSLSLYLGYSDSYDERNGELTIQQYADLDYSGNPAYIKNNAHSAAKSYRAGLAYRYQIGKGVSNRTSFFGSSQDLDNSSAGGWTDKSPLTYGLRSTFDFRFNLSDDIRLSGLAGLELEKTNTLTNGYRMIADSTNLSGYNIVGPIRSIQATTSGTSSWFTQWTLGLPAGFSLTAGLGISNMSLSLEDRLWSATNNHPSNDIPQVYEADYKNIVSPMVALNKKLGESVSVYAAYTTGSKAPVSSYFYIPTTGEVNTGLKPEKGSQIELGAKGSVLDNRLFYTLALFNAKFSDKMTAVSVQNPENTATLYSYIVNGGSLNNKGLEFLVKYELVKSADGFLTSFRPFANITYSDFKYEDFTYQKIGKDASNHDIPVTEDYSGNDVAGVPPLVWNLGVDADTKAGLYGNLNYNYRDAMYFTSDGKNQTSSFGILNAKVGFRKTFSHFGLDLYAGANNLTGQQYYYMVFLNQLPDAYLAAPNEANFFGGVNLKYVF